MAFEGWVLKLLMRMGLGFFKCWVRSSSLIMNVGAKQDQDFWANAK